MQYVFIHGLGQNASSWTQTLSHMGMEEQANCPDLLELLNGQDVTYPNVYSKFSECCDKFAEPLNLCGLSLGGVLALNYAIDHPAKVQSLVLISAQYKMPKALLSVQNAIFRFMPESAFKDMGIPKKSVIQLTKTMSDLDFSERLESVSCPTLIACGEKDKANMKAAKGLADNISGALFQLIENTGHEANTENPEGLAAVLAAFYQKHRV